MLAAFHVYCEQHIYLSLIIAEKRINVKMLPSCAVNYIHPRAGPSGYFIKLKLLSGQQYQNVASCVFIIRTTGPATHGDIKHKLLGKNWVKLGQSLGHPSFGWIG